MIEIILQTCGGGWPVTPEECLPLIQRYRLRIQVKDELPFGPHLRGNVIYVTLEDFGNIVPIILHEVAEYVLRGEEEPPYRMGENIDDERHEIACLVENFGPEPHRLRECAE